jgi:hypothetical protein
MLAVTSNQSMLQRNTIYCTIYWYYIYIVFLCSVLQLLVTANVTSSSPIFVILTMEAIQSYEVSSLTRAIWRNIPDDGILHSRLWFVCASLMTLQLCLQQLSFLLWKPPCFFVCMYTD